MLTQLPKSHAAAREYVIYIRTKKNIKKNVLVHIYTSRRKKKRRKKEEKKEKKIASK